jgi:hypothetical protein
MSVSNVDDINIRYRMIQLKKKYKDFDFSYFYFSKLSRQTDWLTAISEKEPTCSTNHQTRHRPSSEDWHNAFMRISRSRFKTFVVVLDNATEDKQFMKMKRNLEEFVWHRRKYLRPAVKYFLVKRKEFTPNSL